MLKLTEYLTQLPEAKPTSKIFVAMESVASYLLGCFMIDLITVSHSYLQAETATILGQSAVQHCCT